MSQGQRNVTRASQMTQLVLHIYELDTVRISYTVFIGNQ